MNKEEICGLALEAGFMLSSIHGQNTPKLMPVSDSATLVKFAQLVAAHEREQIAEMMDAKGGRMVNTAWVSEAIRARK